MNTDRSPLTHAEVLQLREDLQLTRYHHKAWTSIACGLAAFRIVIGAVVWRVV